DNIFDVYGNFSFTPPIDLIPFQQTVKVTVVDIAGNSTSQVLNVNVQDLSQTPGTLTPPVATEGASTGSVTLFTFTDADLGDTTADYTATVDWGDGNSNTSADGTGTVSVVQT